MKPGLVARGLWLAGTAGLVSGLLWLDQNRGGPASMISRCNLLLSRSEAPAADVLVVGSSRVGTAVDPVAMQQTLARAFTGAAPRVERIAMGHNPPRASLALLENYLHTRGAPRVIVLEIMFLTRRSVDRLAQRQFDIPPEQYLFRRELNLMTFAQILSLPAVAMPFSEHESRLNLWRYRMRGAVLRAGALAYQFLRRPRDTWNLSACDKAAWTREPSWPDDFAFSYGDHDFDAPPGELIGLLQDRMAEIAPNRSLQPWQTKVVRQPYPYDFTDPYRAGEVAVLRSTLDLVSGYRVPVVLLPLPIYGRSPDPDDLSALAGTLPPQAHIFDLYAQINGELDKFWYDDAHLEAYPAGALTTAVLAQHLLETGLLKTNTARPGHD